MYWNKKRINKELFFLLLVIWLGFLFFNLYMPSFRADDLVYSNRLDQLGYLGASIEHYKTWSSRIIIELFMMFFSKHFLLWKFVNSIIMLGTVLMICKYVFEKLDGKNVLLVTSVYCLVPLTVMGETGWESTTLNYQWSVSFCLFAFFPFFQRLKGRAITPSIYWFSLPFLIFAANQEQVNACFFTLTAIITGYLLYKRAYHRLLILPLLISFIELLFSLTTPGNAIRTSQEISKWFPQYDQFGFITKLDLGISSFGKPFFLDTNVLFLILFLFVFLLSYNKCKNYYGRLLSSIPFFLNLIIYLGNTMGESFIHIRGNSRAQIWDSSHLTKLFTATGTNLSLTRPGSWLATLLVLGLLACLLLGIYLSFENKKTASFLMLLMMMGACSRIIMGFSPTIWASGMRTYYILYIVVGILVLMLVKELLKTWNPQKAELVQFSLTMLGIGTIVLTIINR